ncbi:MAG TPA: hypothetical protein VKJ65_07165 [Phycisphaerae bacterium]|nr:hypothetical protein [Phycisphaerae bacterium]
MSDNISAIFGGLEGAGLTAYEVSQGAPVGITQATPGGLISVGTSATANSITPIILIIAIAAVLIFVLR